MRQFGLATKGLFGLVLLVGLVALAQGAASGPLFSASARVVGPDGRLLEIDEPNLLLHRARYRAAAAERLLLRSEDVSPAERPAYRRLAASVARQSLEDRPANPYALIALATARHDLGRGAEALAAVADARRYARHHPPTTPSRIVLAQANWRLMSPQERLELEEDVRVAHTASIRAWRRLEDRHPGLAIIRASIGLER